MSITNSITDHHFNKTQALSIKTRYAVFIKVHNYKRIITDVIIVITSVLSYKSYNKFVAMTKPTYHYYTNFKSLNAMQ